MLHKQYEALNTSVSTLEPVGLKHIGTFVAELKGDLLSSFQEAVEVIYGVPSYTIRPRVR